MAGFYGVQSKLMIGTASGTPDKPLMFISDGLKKRRTMADLNALAGTRSRYAARARPNLQPIAGSLALWPTAVELSNLLPWMLGAAASGTTFALAEALATRSYWVIRGSKIFKYPVVGVDRWTIRARQGEGLMLTLDLVATTEDFATASSSFPSYTIDQTTPPFMMHELVLSVASTPYQCKEIQITGDNSIDKGRFFNTQVLQTIQGTDNTITVSHDLPYGDSAAAFQADAAQTGAAVTATFTSGNVSAVFSMPAVQYEDESPGPVTREEVMLPMTGVARNASAALDQLVVTLDSTP